MGGVALLTGNSRIAIVSLVILFAAGGVLLWLVPDAEATRTVVARLGDRGAIRRARIHPLAVLAALKTYAQGRGMKGHGTWTPVARVIDALDGAFYLAFDNV